MPDGRARTSGDRLPILVFAAVSVVMLAGSVAVRTISPSPFAPRVHVRWLDDVSEAQRATLERSLGLLAGKQRESTTWEYDLARPSHAMIQALIENPTVADTHYVDRAAGEVAPDAPRGTTRLEQPGLAAWVHSSLFDWFIAFWISSFVVSSVRLASPAHPQPR